MGDGLASNIHTQQSNVVNICSGIHADKSHNRQVTLLVQITGTQTPLILLSLSE